jgi:hypothetical protein
MYKMYALQDLQLINANPIIYIWPSIQRVLKILIEDIHVTMYTL